ncbi:MAG: hypothetical protein NXY57DRAFT_967793 [Lentinula lateritia]|nr:MAG: hypothetical protein NXY57DRAFT_967793 [Lentinula lateritia]
MSLPSIDATSGTSSSVGIQPPLNHENADIDELSPTVEDPSLGQLSLFKSVFGVGVSLARYVIDDPLWPILAAAGLPCSYCIRSKKEGSCSVVPHPARCSNCDDKKPCVLGRLARFRYFARKCSRDLAFARRFLEVHGDPGQRTRYSLPSDQWLSISSRIEQSTNSTVALLELNLLDDHYQRELDRQELREFQQRQLSLPSTTIPCSSPVVRDPSPLLPASIPTKRKRPVKVDPGSEVGSNPAPKRLRPVPSAVDSSHAEIAPEGEGTSDYRRVVLVLRPPPVPDLEVLPHLPEAVRRGPEVSVPSSARTPSRSQGSGRLHRRVVSSGSSKQFAPPNAVEDSFRVRINTPPMQQRSQEPLRPYPRSQATSALKAENDRLKAEIEELRGLLAQARGQTSTLTSLLRDTSSSLDVCSQELEASRRSLEEVAVERAEYQRVLTQFQAIEAELPEPHSEDLVTRFHIAHSELVVTKETAREQRREITELRKQVADVEQRSSNAYEELDSANARALRQRDRLEELEDMVCRYRDRAHVAEELIRQYPEDEGLYEVELPSLSDLQRKLNVSEALVHHLATFAHRLYTADPANLLHYHNRYVGGLLEAVTLLLYRGSTHTPDRLPSIVKLVLDYLTQARFMHGELHLRSISSLLYYYSNAADRVDGLYQEMLSHSRFPSHNAFLTAAQHVGYVDARPGSMEPPLHRRFFSFDHPIPIPPTPMSDHLPAVPAMDSIMETWERLIVNYIRDMIDTPGPRYQFPGLELLGFAGEPNSTTGVDEDTPMVGDERPISPSVEGSTEVGPRGEVTTLGGGRDTELLVGGSEGPTGARTPLFLPDSRSSSPRPPLSSIPVIPVVIDLTMVDDDGEDLYESREEFETRIQGDAAVKSERSSPNLS